MTKECKFEVGDRVVCIDAGNYPATLMELGKEYTVSKVRPNETYIEVENSCGMFFGTFRFEKAPIVAYTSKVVSLNDFYKGVSAGSIEAEEGAIEANFLAADKESFEGVLKVLNQIYEELHQ
jgi:hypothetical protein